VAVLLWLPAARRALDRLADALAGAGTRLTAAVRTG
jgi:hypothetical protein